MFSIVTIAGGLISAVAFAQIEAGTIHLNTTTIHYGLIKKDSDPFRKFIVTNVGKFPLTISSCSATCGCTVPNCPQEPIPSGKSALIRVRYNTGRVGPFEKKVTVYSNDQKNPVTVLTIQGEVIE